MGKAVSQLVILALLLPFISYYGATRAAAQGCYNESAVRDVPELLRRTYFSRGNDDRYTVRPFLQADGGDIGGRDPAACRNSATARLDAAARGLAGDAPAGE